MVLRCQRRIVVGAAGNEGLLLRRQLAQRLGGAAGEDVAGGDHGAGRHDGACIGKVDDALHTS